MKVRIEVILDDGSITDTEAEGSDFDLTLDTVADRIRRFLDGEDES